MLDDFEFWSLVALFVIILIFGAGYEAGSSGKPVKGEHCKCFTCRKENKK